VKKVDVQLWTFWDVLAEIATSLYSSESLRSGAGAPRVYTNVGNFSRLHVAVKGICRECKSYSEQTGICQGHMALELLFARWLGVGA